MQNSNRPPRIFIGLKEIAGYYRNLKGGFDALGIDCAFVCLNKHPFEYGVENNPPWADRVNRFSQAVGGAFQKRLPLKILWMALFQPLLSLPVFVYALFRYDVFIFGSVSTFFFFLDLPILKLFGKKVIYVFNGSDARPIYMNGFMMRHTRTWMVLLGIVLARIQKTILSIVDRFADHIVNNPPMAYFHTRPIVSGFVIGLPSQACSRPAPLVVSKRANKPLRVLHAPSKPGPKGSDKIRAAIEKLQSEGIQIDFIEITGRPNHEVLAELQSCDFIVDQLYSDTPMAGFPLEAAAFGKPALVGGYYSDHIEKDIPEDFRPPSLFCHPDQLLESLRELATDEKLRQHLGRKAYEFVTKVWNAEETARRYLQVIDGSAPHNWSFNPQEIDYLWGCGISQERYRQLLKRFLSVGGRFSFCLGDKPLLLERLLRISQQSEQESSSSTSASSTEQESTSIAKNA